MKLLKPSQSEQILAYLKAGGTLTVLDALTMFGCYALSQRCGEIARAGEPIVSDMVTMDNGKRVARYRYAVDGEQVRLAL